MRHRFTAGLLTVAMGAGLMTVGAPAVHASSKGRKNTAIGLGALAAYGLLSGKTGVGLAAGAGAAYAYKRYRDSRKNERRYNRYYSRYGSRYRTNSADGGFQFPVGYGGSDNYPYGGQYQYGDYPYQNGGQYQYGGSQYRRRTRERPYTRGDSRPYVTDEWGNRRYYDPSQGDGYHRYDGRRYRRAGFRSRYDVDTQSSQYDNSVQYCPPGSSRGRKNGWRKR
jgi:hypothetical protein